MQCIPPSHKPDVTANYNLSSSYHLRNNIHAFLELTCTILPALYVIRLKPLRPCSIFKGRYTYLCFRFQIVRLTTTVLTCILIVCPICRHAPNILHLILNQKLFGPISALMLPSCNNIALGRFLSAIHYHTWAC